MKKLLLAAVLFAGTTLAFAKDNVKSSTNNLKIEKTLSLEKITPSSEKEIVSPKKICGQLVYSEQQESYYDMQSNTIVTHTVGYFTH